MGLYEKYPILRWGYIRAGTIFERGRYTERFDISGKILQKISKSLYFKRNIQKKLIARNFH